MKPTILYDDFDKIDVRIGKVLAVTMPEWSQKLLRFEVDFGSEIGQRVIFSGIKQWYTAEDFIGRSFPFIINLAPKKMGPEESQGMMMMADGEEKPILFSLNQEVLPGTTVR